MSRNLLLAADEDYSIGGLEISTPEQSLVGASELPFTRPTGTIQTREYEIVLAGDGCGGVHPDVIGKIAAFEGGRCTDYEKTLAAQSAGAVGLRDRRSSGGHADDGEHVEQAAEPDSFVWGVYVEDGLIYLSDEMTGLWIVRLTSGRDATAVE